MLAEACHAADSEAGRFSFEGGVDLHAERIRQYIELRKKFHLRNAKRESYLHASK